MRFLIDNNGLMVALFFHRFIVMKGLQMLF